MKSRCWWLIAAVVPMLVSCASTPVVLAPVGPEPAPWSGLEPSAGTGGLQVFTATDEYELDHDVPYFPHQDYEIYSGTGSRLRRVWNSQSHEDETPAVVTLPAGKYLVKADAELYGFVTVPVVIRPAELTRVILQPGWSPKPAVARSELVRIPQGYYVGWRASSDGGQR
jgi:hypothetical protein